MKLELNDFKPIEISISKEKSDMTNQLYIDGLIKLKQPITAAPTFTPKKFIDQIQFAHIGADYKLYLYIDNAWKSITLT